jgi:YidC/Oxa1 family membrane protein insertase
MRNKKIILLVLLCLGLFLLTGCSQTNVTVQDQTFIKPFNTLWDETGFLGPLTYLIALLMHWVSTWFTTGQFAFAIIIGTIVIRSVAWPIYAKSNDMTLKMQLAQPEMERLQQKYAQRKDPQSQQRMQQEMLAIYRKYKINMFGCLMPFLQMPLFLSMYRCVTRITAGPVVNPSTGETVLEAALQISDSSFLGINDCLSRGVIGSEWSASSIVGIILALIVGGTMFLLNLISQRQPKYIKKKPNQQKGQMGLTMKIMNYVMIAMMVYFSLTNNAIALYWVVGNIYSIIQTLINRKLNEIKFYKMRSDVDNLIG